MSSAVAIDVDAAAADLATRRSHPYRARATVVMFCLLSCGILRQVIRMASSYQEGALKSVSGGLV